MGAREERRRKRDAKLPAVTHRDGASELPVEVGRRAELVERQAMEVVLPESLEQELRRPRANFARRLLICYFRVFVRERKASGKQERVNVRIPLPIPLFGLLMRRRLSPSQALAAEAIAYEHGLGSEIQRYLDSAMAFEIVRVEEQSAHKTSLVVVGFD